MTQIVIDESWLSLNFQYMVSMVVSIFVIFIGGLFYKFLTFNEIVVDLSDTKWNYKDFDLKRIYKLEELPPFYPNGWISVLESRDLKINQIKPVFAFGYDLVVFRGSSGNIYVADAYCPHLGANLGVGGQVIGDSIRCPFHGWTYKSDGICTEVPGIQCSKLPSAQIKLWQSIEVNGFIFVWHHSDGRSPEWYPIKINDIEKSRFVYRGRAEHIVNCHLQEIPENGADIQHLNELHSSPEFLGTVISRSKFYNLLTKFLRYDWKADWRLSPPPDKHIALLDMKADYSLFGKSFMRVNLFIQQIGPANVHLNLKAHCLADIDIRIIQTITPLAQMKHKIIHHFYSEPTFKGLLFSKFVIYGEARMIERDIIIWNNKKFLKKPFFAKNEAPLVKFRRWFNQFYTQKCPASF